MHIAASEFEDKIVSERQLSGESRTITQNSHAMQESSFPFQGTFFRLRPATPNSDLDPVHIVAAH